MSNQQPTGFKELLNAMMQRRWYMTAIVLITFLFLTLGIVISIHMNTNVGQEWKELLLLMLGAFIGSYGKIIDYWFSDTDKDKMLVQKMDEEDGVSLSHTNDMKETNKPFTPIIPDAFVQGAQAARELAVVENKQKHELATDQQEHDQAMTKDKQEHEQEMEKLEFEYQTHRQCDHEWGESDHDGEEECQKCGKIKDPH